MSPCACAWRSLRYATDSVSGTPTPRATAVCRNLGCDMSRVVKIASCVGVTDMYNVQSVNKWSNLMLFQEYFSFFKVHNNICFENYQRNRAVSQEKFEFSESTYSLALQTVCWIWRTPIGMHSKAQCGQSVSTEDLYCTVGWSVEIFFCGQNRSSNQRSAVLGTCATFSATGANWKRWRMLLWH